MVEPWHAWFKLRRGCVFTKKTKGKKNENHQQPMVFEESTFPHGLMVINWGSVWPLETEGPATIFRKAPGWTVDIPKVCPNGVSDAVNDADRNWIFGYLGSSLDEGDPENWHWSLAFALEVVLKIVYVGGLRVFEAVSHQTFGKKKTSVFC